MTHVAKWKFEEVEKLKKLILEYPVVGVADIAGIPARQLQQMRNLLRDEVLIKMSRKSLMRHAIEKASKEERSLKDLAGHVDGQAVFIFSKMDPFKLAKILRKNRAKAPVKPNSITPTDIVVHKGETPFPPGPLLGELQQAGIPATIQGGKIVIKEDKVVAKAGEKVSPLVAAALSRLGVEPLEIGIQLLAAYEGGTVFPAETLSIDEEEVKKQLALSHAQAVSLILESGYVTKEVAPLVIQKCFLEARALALEAGIYEKEVMDQLLSRAYLQMLSLASMLKEEALDEDLAARTKARAGARKEKKEKEEAPAEEKPEEKPEEEEEAMSGLGALFG
jgi:large subunit ribosomal protein L10